MKDLNSTDDKKVLKALEEANAKGDIKWVRPLLYAFRDRKNKKRAFRNLWVARINAASRELNVSYSKLINGLDSKNIILNRKILSDIAINDTTTFKEVVKTAID